MITLEFQHVDVFSRRAFQGNGLVVVLDAEELSPELMQAVTREVRQFETVFLTGVDLDRRSAMLRIFTEDEELDFGGHPVLGAAAVLHGKLPRGQQGEKWWTHSRKRGLSDAASSDELVAEIRCPVRARLPTNRPVLARTPWRVVASCSPEAPQAPVPE